MGDGVLSKKTGLIYHELKRSADRKYSLTLSLLCVCVRTHTHSHTHTPLIRSEAGPLTTSTNNCNFGLVTGSRMSIHKLHIHTLRHRPTRIHKNTQTHTLHHIYTRIT